MVALLDMIVMKEVDDRGESPLNLSKNGPSERLEKSLNSPPSEETELERVERLGRERPAQFQSVWAEGLFVYSILASQFMAVSLGETLPSWSFFC